MIYAYLLFRLIHPLVGFLKDFDPKAVSINTGSCGYSYWYTVGDVLHWPAIEGLSPGLYPSVVDFVKVDPAFVPCEEPEPESQSLATFSLLTKIFDENR